jgi:hypothetical protein
MKALRLIAAIALASGLLSIAHANPVPAVPAFAWNTEGGFMDGTATCTNGAPANCSLTFSGAADPSHVILTPSGPYVTPDSHTAINWGTSTGPGQSGLFATHHSDLDMGAIVTNGGWVTIDAFSHINNPIAASGGALNAVDVYGQFNLTPPGLAVGHGINPVAFTETVNLATPADCPPPNPAGTACDDYFDTPTLNGTSFLFSDGSFNYYLSFQFLDGPNAFVEPSPIAGDIRIYTAENAVSTIFTQARIDAVAIPEPGILALFGIALAAMGFVRGRRQRS